ncbi:hypothetical protein [Acinetobacter gyllenbergii]|uniref:hypothetical protein n=1 Tax=Acinetobacter gyllenbergii TaxID=134534 RepID=UPI0008069388|nr:hypothetical protein [Acinetobacter gyllenbergii]OBY75243.1 hypothetical protein NG55_00750 [Acinetobacter gyllenbergii]
MKFNFSLDVAIALTLITVFLFTSGQIYLNGYLGYFLVDPIALNFSVQDKIYLGFLRGINQLLYLCTACLIMFFLRYIFVYFDLAKKLDAKLLSYIPKNERSPEKVLRIHNSQHYDQLDQNFSVVVLNSLLVLALLWGTIQAFVYIENSSKDIAQKVMKNIDVLPKITVKDQNDLTNKYLLKCGSTLCAVIDEQKNVSLVEPKNVVYLSSNFAEKPEKKS